MLKYRKTRITLGKIKNRGVRETFRLFLFNFKHFRAQSKIEIKKISDAKSQENNRYFQYKKKYISKKENPEFKLKRCSKILAIYTNKIIFKMCYIQSSEIVEKLYRLIENK